MTYPCRDIDGKEHPGTGQNLEYHLKPKHVCYMLSSLYNKIKEKNQDIYAHTHTYRNPHLIIEKNRPFPQPPPWATPFKKIRGRSSTVLVLSILQRKQKRNLKIKIINPPPPKKKGGGGGRKR